MQSLSDELPAFVSEETLTRLQQLAEQSGRLAEEVRHAIEWRLAQPPRLVAEPLDGATVQAPKKRGRPRQASDSQAEAVGDGTSSEEKGRVSR
jgi:hypothetical protein